MRQAITTRYLGPTNHRGSRVKATAQAGSLTVPWDHAEDVDWNHTTAATALAAKLGWLTKGWSLAPGGLPGGTGNVYVLVYQAAVSQHCGGHGGSCRFCKGTGEEQ